eukprot:6174389-Pleurochrysis_carterae.AAC.2
MVVDWVATAPRAPGFAASMIECCVTDLGLLDIAGPVSLSQRSTRPPYVSQWWIFLKDVAPLEEQSVTGAAVPSPSGRDHSVRAAAGPLPLDACRVQ